MRLISTINRSIGFKAKIYYNSDLSEYVVKFINPENITMSEPYNYYSDNKDDAINTAHAQLDFMVQNEVIA